LSKNDRGTTEATSFSTLAGVSTDDRGNGHVVGEPVTVRDAPPKARAAPKRKQPTIDPREEGIAKRAAPRTTKRRTTNPDAAIVAPILQTTRDAVALPQADRSTSADLALPVHLPPIQLQPDPPEEDDRPEPVTAWVPTVLAPSTPSILVEPEVFEVEPEAFELAAEPQVAIAPSDGVSQQTRVVQSGRRPRRRVRRVTRVVRHVDPWSVFKVALVFSFVLYGICLTAGVLLWNVAYTTGTIDNLQKFFESFGWSSFRFKGGQLFHNAWIAGLFGALGLTGLALLGATLFNLITDLVGGIRVTVLEEEVVERNPVASGLLLRASSRRTNAALPVDTTPTLDDSVEQPG
jgi:hypothetical protein